MLILIPDNKTILPCSSYKHGMAWVGRDLKDPTATGKAATQKINSYNYLWKYSKEFDPALIYT